VPHGDEGEPVILAAIRKLDAAHAEFFRARSRSAQGGTCAQGRDDWNIESSLAPLRQANLLAGQISTASGAASEDRPSAFRLVGSGWTGNTR
jgi:hypothetical protein